MSQVIKVGARSLEGAGEKDYFKELVILTSLFFMWGVLTCLNDILVPHLKAVFSLSYTQAMLVQFCFFGAYFLVSPVSGILLKSIGYKKGIIVGLTVAGAGCMMFYPAAGSRQYYLFLIALFVLASGITLLQVSANPYVTILGNPETASSRLTLTQAFNSLGTTVAPYFGSLLILSGVTLAPEEIMNLSAVELEAYRMAESSSVQIPYIVLSVVLLLAALVFSMLKLPSIGDDELAEYDPDAARCVRKSIWEYPHLLLGAIAIFMYVGAEVSIGSFLVNFISLREIGDVSRVTAGKLVSYYWGGAMLGRFVGSAIMQKVKPKAVLAGNAVAAIFLVIFTVFASGKAAMFSILLVGLFNSIMFPTIFSLSVKGLGPHTCQASGLLCMAIVGGAVMPVIQGLLADGIGVHYSFAMHTLCYSFILFFALRGSRYGQEKSV